MINVLEKYSEYTAKLEKMKKEYLELKVLNEDDRVNYEVCQKAQANARTLRGQIEKRRTELKAPFLEAERTIDKFAKEITQDLLAVEEHLKSERKKVDDARERRRKQKEAEIKAERERLARIEMEKLEAKRKEIEEKARKEREEIERKQKELEQREAELKQKELEQKEKEIPAKEEQPDLPNTDSILDPPKPITRREMLAFLVDLISAYYTGDIRKVDIRRAENLKKRLERMIKNQ